jgi:hypothetical protein
MIERTPFLPRRDVSAVACKNCMAGLTEKCHNDCCKAPERIIYDAHSGTPPTSGIALMGV